MDNKIFILYSASYMDWKPVAKFKSLEDLKNECINNFGFPKEILLDDELFDDNLEGYEMKYDVI